MFQAKSIFSLLKPLRLRHVLQLHEETYIFTKMIANKNFKLVRTVFVM